MPDHRWTTDERPDPDNIRTRSEFGQALTALRMIVGLTVRQVAAKAGGGSAHSTIEDWFAGRVLPSASSRELLIRVLAVCAVPEHETENWLRAWRNVRRAPGPRAAGHEPYLGLASFQPEDAGWFFGRTSLTERLVDRVVGLAGAGGGLQVVVGASGSGKSSLVRAGLVAALRDGAGHPATDWSVTLTTPGQQSFVREVVAAEPAGRSDATRTGAVDQGPARHRVVVVDQFEEIFALRVAEEERRRFIDRLVGLTTGPNGAVVVLALRADFYAHALRYPALLAAMMHGQLTVGPMTEDELRSAIVEPARKARVDLADGLVELLLRTIAPRTGAGASPETGVLPLLSHALYATWHHDHKTSLTIDGYRAVGGIEGAVAASAEAVYRDLTVDERVLARRLFLSLVQVNQDAADTRRRMTMRELHTEFRKEQWEQLQQVLDRYVRQRLVTADTDSVEISHEALITAWPTLRTWLDADRAGLVLGQQLSAAAAQWRREDRDSALLYRGSRLAVAQDWAAARPDELPPATSEFVHASTRYARRRSRRLYQVIAALSALTLVTFGLAGYAFDQRTTANGQRQDAVEQRDRALSRLMAGRVDRLRTSDVSLAMQLSLAAYRMAPTVEARSSLLDAYVTPGATRLDSFATAAQAVAYSPDKQLLAAGSTDHTLRIWRTDDPDRPPTPIGAPLTGPTGPVYSVAFSPDSRLLAAGGADGSVWIWDVTQPGQPVRSAPLEGATSTIYSVAFDPTGRLLAAGGADRAVRLWDITEPGNIQARPAAPGHTDAIQSVAFDPAGEVLASGSADTTVQLWNVTGPGRPVPLGQPLLDHTGKVRAVGFSPDGDTLASGSEDRSVRLWNVTEPDRIRTVGEPLTGPTSWVNSVAFSPDGRTIAGAGSDKAVTVWTRDGGEPLARLPHPATVTGVSFGSDARTLASSALDGTVRLWRLPGPIPTGPTDAVFNIAYGGDGAILAAASRDRAVRLWRVDQPRQPVPVGTPIVSPPGLDPYAGTLAFSPDGATLAVGTRSGTLQLWSVADPTRPVWHSEPLTGPTALLQAVAFTPDGHTLAAGGDDGSVHLWDVRDLRRPAPLATVPGAGAIILSLVFSPDSRTLAVGSTDTHARLIDVTEPSRPVRIDVPLDGFTGYTISVAFSPNRRVLAVGSADKTVRLWDVTNPAVPVPLGSPLTGPGGDVYSVAFDPDSRLLAAAVTDGTVWLWDVTDPSRPAVDATLTRPAGATYTVAFSPDRETLAAGDAAGGIRIWDLDLNRIATWICATAGVGISPEEWRHYIPGAPFTPPC